VPTDAPGSAPLRIAMWSGPRNISTALMRSFGSRDDTFVCDEPLYAHYLRETGLQHPVADEIIARHESDWRKVVEWLTGPVPEGKPVFYQKHMAHHLLPGIERGWLSALRHVFLIREPAEMLTSLVRITPSPRLEDTGLPQQVELFEAEARRTGKRPPVVDSRDLLEDPAGVLTALCQKLGLEYQPAMLSWQPGPRATDGCWGPMWYGNTLASTGFTPYQPKDEPVPDALADVYARCCELYDTLHHHRIRTR